MINSFKNYLFKRDEMAGWHLIGLTLLYFLVGYYINFNPVIMFTVLWVVDYLFYYVFTEKLDMKKKIKQKGREKRGF